MDADDTNAFSPDRNRIVFDRISVYTISASVGNISLAVVTSVEG